VQPMIKLSLKGLAKYVASSPAAQRKILQDFKYPAGDEPFAMRVYYREAMDCLKHYIREQHSPDWLQEQARQLTSKVDGAAAKSIGRLRQNARAVLLFERLFRKTGIEVLETPRFRLTYHGVTISVVPDLCLLDGTRKKLVKIQFGGKKLADQSVNVITQCMLEAANAGGYDLSASSCVYVDLPRESVRAAPRAGKRTLQDVKAACETITQIWESIPPPRKSKRSVAA
jgi:hypothetical protein